MRNFERPDSEPASERDHRTRRSWCYVLALLANLIPAAAGAQGLTLVGAKDGAVDVVVPPSGVAPLVFHRTEPGATVFDIDASAFLSADGQFASVALATAGTKGSPTSSRIEFSQDGHRAALELQASDLDPGVEYLGTLTASSPGGIVTWTVTVRGPRPKPDPTVELKTDLDERELEITDWVLWDGTDDRAGFTITVFEATRAVAVRGLTVRRADGSESSASIDLERNLRFHIDGVAIPNLSSWPDPQQDSASLRDIPGDGQRVLRISVVDLPRGEHRAVLQLDALNAKPGSAPTVALTVRVRHAADLAIALLVAAILVSIFVTNVIVNWRQRLDLHKRARSLRREWLQDLPELAPLVWLNATRRHAEMSLERFTLLRSPDELAERLDKAGNLLTLLHRYRDLQRHLVRRNFHYMEHWRLQGEIDAIVSRIEPDVLDEANAATIRSELDAFEEGLADHVSLYKPLVMAGRRKARQVVSRPWLEDLLTKIQVGPTQGEQLGKLLKSYVEDEPPPNPSESELVVLDRVCCSFRVLKRHAQDKDRSTLLKLVELIAQPEATAIQIDRVFQLTDSATWDRVMTEIESKRLTLTPTAAVEELRPTRFAVELDDEDLNDRFVVKSRMTADWSFLLEPSPRGWSGKFGKRPKPQTHAWSRRAKGQSIVQFAPAPGTLKMSVCMRYSDRACTPIESGIAVQRSKRNLYRRLVEKGESGLLLLSMAIALVSGLVLYYVPNPTFGTLQDYLALFTWGVGVDQGKNLVQTLQSLRSQAQPEDAA